MKWAVRFWSTGCGEFTQEFETHALALTACDEWQKMCRGHMICCSTFVFQVRT